MNTLYIDGLSNKSLFLSLSLSVFSLSVFSLFLLSLSHSRLSLNNCVKRDYTKYDMICQSSFSLKIDYTKYDMHIMKSLKDFFFNNEVSL